MKELPPWTEWPSYNDLSYFKLSDKKQMNARFIKHQCLEMTDVKPYARESMIAFKKLDISYDPYLEEKVL